MSNLGQKRERDDLDALLGGVGGAPTATNAGGGLPFPSARPAMAFNRNQRRGVGMLMGASSTTKAPPSSLSSTDLTPASTTNATVTATTATLAGADLLAQLGLGTSFVQEAADKEHLQRLKATLNLTLHNESVITSLFSAGAPQYDPFNEPFLAIKSADRPLLIDEELMKDRLGRLHHPLPTLEGSLLATEVPPPPIKLHKTPEELKKERHARALAKREAHQAKLKEGKDAEEQKMRLRNLHDSLKERWEANPLGTESEIRKQMQERLENHQRTNYERHMAALPQQIERREEKLLLKAETNVVLSVYRVFPIREKTSLGMFVEFANDKRLRGFVIWMDNRDALVVLMGGPAPMRHLDNWLTHRMQWRASANTVCNKVFTTRVEKLDRFSFHERARGEKKEEGSATSKAGASTVEEEEVYEEGTVEHAEQQAVYLKELKSIAAGQEFFHETMPTKGPWPSLAFLWRAAMGTVPSEE